MKEKNTEADMTGFDIDAVAAQAHLTLRAEEKENTERELRRLIALTEELLRAAPPEGKAYDGAILPSSCGREDIPAVPGDQEERMRCSAVTDGAYYVVPHIMGGEET